MESELHDKLRSLKNLMGSLHYQAQTSESGSVTLDVDALKTILDTLREAERELI